jgi:hypothetical protein
MFFLESFEYHAAPVIVSKKFENTVSFVKIWVRSSAWDFFLYTFFIYFINFPSAVEMSSSIQNFSIITFFCKRNSMFSVLEKTVSA